MPADDRPFIEQCIGSEWPKALYPHGAGREWSTKMHDEWKAAQAFEVVPASERDRLCEAEKLALQLKDEAERCVKDLLAENETLQAERDLLLADATRLADGLRARGIVPGRNPDGINDDAEKALVLYDDAMAEVKRLRRLIGEAYTARSPQPYMAIRKLFRETNLTPASDEIGETT